MSDFHLVLEEQVPRLMRYAAALTRDPEEAGELVEDTVREALARQRDLSRGGEVWVRLLTILHELRDNPFRRTVPEAIGACPVGDPAAGRTLSRFDRALGRLPEAQRAAILLVGLEDLSYDEAGAILGISAGAVHSRLTRGRDSLRRAMGTAAGRTRLARAA